MMEFLYILLELVPLAYYYVIICLVGPSDMFGYDLFRILLAVYGTGAIILYKLIQTKKSVDELREKLSKMESKQIEIEKERTLSASEPEADAESDR